jgi:hypothetical protein
VYTTHPSGTLIIGESDECPSAGGELNVGLIELANGLISGHVRNSVGEPIGDVEVTVGSELGIAVCESDSNGAFSLGLLPEGVYRIELRPASSIYAIGGSRAVTVDAVGGAQDIEFVLSFAGQVSGSVMTSTGGIGGATVQTTVLLPGDTVPFTTQMTESNGDGSYVLTNLPAGASYAIIARADGYAHGYVTDIMVLAGELTSGVDFNLNPTDPGKVSGSVLEKLTMEPVDGAAIFFTGENGSTSLALTDAQGAYTSDELPAGLYSVQVLAVGYVLPEEETMQIEVISGETNQELNIMVESE